MPAFKKHFLAIHLHALLQHAVDMVDERADRIAAGKAGKGQCKFIGTQLRQNAVVAAIGFQPLRQRAQGTVDGLMAEDLDDLIQPAQFDIKQSQITGFARRAWVICCMRCSSRMRLGRPVCAS